jgi:hypothetical protein
MERGKDIRVVDGMKGANLSILPGGVTSRRNRMSIPKANPLHNRQENSYVTKSSK